MPANVHKNGKQKYQLIVTAALELLELLVHSRMKFDENVGVQSLTCSKTTAEFGCPFVVELVGSVEKIWSETEPYLKKYIP